MLAKLSSRFFLLIAVCSIIFLPVLGARQAQAESAEMIDAKVDLALKALYKNSPAARKQAEAAKGILVFPDIVKAGLMIGGQYGVGALRIAGKTEGYYNVVEGSFGLQAGAQSFGYALFFMDEEALEYLQSSDGWEVGVGPSITIVDEGLAGSLTTTTGQDNIYAFFFDQKGLMGGLGLKGSKISQITPDE